MIYNAEERLQQIAQAPYLPPVGPEDVSPLPGILPHGGQGAFPFGGPLPSPVPALSESIAAPVKAIENYLDQKIANGRKLLANGSFYALLLLLFLIGVIGLVWGSTPRVARAARAVGAHG